MTKVRTIAVLEVISHVGSFNSAILKTFRGTFDLQKKKLEYLTLLMNMQKLISEHADHSSMIKKVDHRACF